MTDLTDRMRTCAAAMLYEAGPDETKKQWQDDAVIYRDAAALLIEASNIIEAAQYPPGAPMEAIPLAIAKSVALPTDPGGAAWIGNDLKPIPDATRSRNACPQCDSRTNKTVYRRSNRFVLECPVCGHVWERA